jgi:hypothetical protein
MHFTFLSAFLVAVIIRASAVPQFNHDSTSPIAISSTDLSQRNSVPPTQIERIPHLNTDKRALIFNQQAEFTEKEDRIDAQIPQRGKPSNGKPSNQKQPGLKAGAKGKEGKELGGKLGSLGQFLPTFTTIRRAAAEAEATLIPNAER